MRRHVFSEGLFLACVLLLSVGLIGLGWCGTASATEMDWDSGPKRSAPGVTATGGGGGGGGSAYVGGDRYDFDDYPVHTAIAGACGGAIQARDVGAALNPLSTVCELSAGISTALGVCAARRGADSCREAEVLLKILVSRLKTSAEPTGLRGAWIGITDKLPLLGARWLRWLW